MWPRGPSLYQQGPRTSNYLPFENRSPNNQGIQRGRRDILGYTRHDVPFYNLNSLNSFNNNPSPRMSSGRMFSGGNNFVNSALMSGSQSSQSNRRQRNTEENRVRSNDGISFKKTTKAKNNKHDNKREQADEIDSFVKLYCCPKCGDSYTFHNSRNRCIGKIPLIIHCNHTMCQECIYQNLKNDKINCPTCFVDTTINQHDIPVCQTDLQNIFPPNYYIIGVLSYNRFRSGLFKNFEDMRLVSTSCKKQVPALTSSELCCFSSCSKEATMYCPSCEGIYCNDCCTVVHKSVKNLMSHEPVPRQKHGFSLILENCGIHPQMKVEFFCKQCDLTACCYCVLDEHTDHERIPLYHLDDSEMEEFKTLKKKAEKTLKEILATQKKATKLANYSTENIKKEILQHFADYHAKIFSIEKQLRDEVECFKNTNSYCRGLEIIQNSLSTSAVQLKQLVTFNESAIKDKKFNLKGALKILRDMKNIPRFLLNETGNLEPLRLVIDPTVMDSLSDAFMVEKCDHSEYKLVTDAELPEGYLLDNIDDTVSDTEVKSKVSSNHSESMTTNELPTMISSRKSQKLKKKHLVPKMPSQLVMENIEVQHINSMDSFFIQYKNSQSALIHLNKDIENYVKIGGAQPVVDPQLNKIYLALYTTESRATSQKEELWCRARLIKINNNENGTRYEMFFIDYGKVQVIDGNRIKDIPSFLVSKKPFAIECRLYNPMGISWNKQAHYSLARILNGKEVHMMVKSIEIGIYDVDLLITSSDGGVTSVIDILVHTTNSVESVDDTVSLDGSISYRKDGYFPHLRIFPNSTKFSKNQEEQVVIANVVDPYNIFIHIMTNCEAFKSLCNDIKKAYKHSKSGRCMPIEGTYTLVEYKDIVCSNYHRAFIKNVDLDTDKAHVLLVDWGINVVVNISNIRQLPESLTKMECQAVLVKLAHIAPIKSQRTWSHKATSFLQIYQRSQKVLKMIVHQSEPEVQVALFDVTSNVDLCLNAKMVENNLAESSGSISTKLEWPNFRTEASKFCEDEGLLASLIKKIDEDADQDSEEENSSNVKKLQVDVVKVESPDVIWVRFLKYHDRDSALSKELQIHYSQEQETKDAWSVDETCVVELDTEFARGKILEEADGKYKVYLYDKVQEVTLPVEKIFLYDKYFQCYPQVVIKSHLANIKPAGDTGKWSGSSVEALQAIFLKHPRIYACKSAEKEVLKKTLPLDMWYGVVIKGGALDPDRMKYVSINRFLVKLGFAYKVASPSIAIKEDLAGEELLKGLTKEIISHAEEASEKIQGDKSNEIDDEHTHIGKHEILKEKVKIVEEPLRSELAATHTNSENENEAHMKPAGNDDAPKNWSDIIEEELRNAASNNLQKFKRVSVMSDSTEETQEGPPQHKREISIDDWLPPFRLTKKEFQGRVTCVETAGSLYLHEESLDKVYYKMEANMKEYFDDNPPKLTDSKWEPGQLCTIKYDDGKWYRGRILKVKNPQKISVFMVDFGSDHDLLPDNLFREILYTDIECFATKVKLDKVYSRGSTWLSSDYDNFHNLVTDWCRIIVKGPLDVDIPSVDVYNEAGIYINDRLVELCPNLSRYSNIPIELVTDDDESAIIETEDAEELESEKSPTEDMNSEPSYESQNKVMSNSDTEVLTYKKRPIPEELLEGKKIMFEIGGFNTINQVALKAPDENVSEDMYDLTLDIQDAVNSLPPLIDFEVGTPCLAQFSEDEVWYRARVFDIQTKIPEFLDVFFVDYGNIESVAISKVRKILPEYMNLPQQTWEAALNIVLLAEDQTDIVKQEMNKLDRKRMYIKLVEEEPLTVDLYDKHGELCYQSLITNGCLKMAQEYEDTD